jgi:hypothetical protein
VFWVCVVLFWGSLPLFYLLNIRKHSSPAFSRKKSFCGTIYGCRCNIDVVSSLPIMQLDIQQLSIEGISGLQIIALTSDISFLKTSTVILAHLHGWGSTFPTQQIKHASFALKYTLTTILNARFIHHWHQNTGAQGTREAVSRGEPGHLLHTADDRIECARNAAS